MRRLLLLTAFALLLGSLGCQWHPTAPACPLLVDTTAVQHVGAVVIGTVPLRCVAKPKP